MEPGDLGQQRFLAVLVFCESPGLIIKRTLEEGLDLEGVILFKEREDDSLAFLVADNQGNSLIIGENSFYFSVGFVEGDELIDSVKDLYEIFIVALLILLILLLKGHDD